jgi:hypothetical protein
MFGEPNVKFPGPAAPRPHRANCRGIRCQLHPQGALSKGLHIRNHPRDLASATITFHTLGMVVSKLSMFLRLCVTLNSYSDWS